MKKKTLSTVKFLVILGLFLAPISKSYAQNPQTIAKSKTLTKTSFFSGWSKFQIWTTTILGTAGVAAAAGGGGGGGGGSDGGGNGNNNQSPSNQVTTPQQEFDNQYGLSKINADDAYLRGYPNNNIIVAVVDSGVDLDHPDLVANIYSNGRDFANNDFNANSDGYDSHGTHVAGIIAATKNNIGIHGVAYQAKILPVKIASSVNGAPFTNFNNIASAINYSVSSGAEIINNSWGIDITNPILVSNYDGISQGGNGDGIVDIRDINGESELTTLFGSNFINAFKNADQNGVVVVFAAGNDGHSQTGLEAAFPHLIGSIQDHWVAVVATDQNNNITDFSNRCGLAKNWCIAAPGNAIFSTVDLNDRNTSIDTNNDGYEYFSGTSMSAPHVSGAIALLMQQFPTLTSAEALQILFDSAYDLGESGVDNVYGHGLLNLANALSPLGNRFLALDNSINGEVMIVDSTKTSNGIFANAFANQNIEAAILDKYQRTYSVNLSNFATTDQSKNFYNLFADFNKKYQKTILPITTNSQFTFFRDTQKIYGNNSDPRDLSSFSFSSQISDQSNLALNYNISMRKAFNSAIFNDDEKEILQLSQESASSNPFLNFAESGFNSVFSLNKKDSKIQFTSFFANQKDEYFDENGDLKNFNETRKINGFAAEYVKSFNSSSFGLQFGQINETGSFLGSINEGAFALDDKTTTYFGNISAKFNLGAKTVFYGNYNYGISLPQTTQNSLIAEISKVTTSSFGVSLVKKDFVKRNNDFGLAISQPLRIESGSANLDLPVGRTMSGEVVRQNMVLNLNPDGREIDFESFYKFSLNKNSDLKGKLLYRVSPNHDKNAKNEGIFFLSYSKFF